MNSKNSTLKTALACAAIGWLGYGSGTVCLAQTAASPAGLSPDLQEVVKLSQAHMPDDVIRNYITSTGKSYRLGADDIIYLNSQGVSAGVISALQTANIAPVAAPEPVPAPAPVQTLPPVAQPVSAMPATTYVPAPAPAPATVGVAAPAMPPMVNFQYFHDQLAPYGAWITVNGVMYWRPDQAIAINPDWRPYYDMGQWVETDNGLYWQSNYMWGDIPFHYGRWVFSPGMGWLWAPDYVWGPAWVFWRHDEVDGVIGWAPLPMGAVFVEGGFRYRGMIVGADFDFGLGEGCFTFVGYDHFHEPFIRMRGHEWAYHIDHERLHGFFGHSVPRNEFRRDDHGRFINNGIGHDRMEHLTHVQHAGFDERNPVGDHNREGAQHGDAGHGDAGHGAAGNPGGNHAAGGAEKSGGGNNAAHPASQGAPGAANGGNKAYRPPASSGQSGASGQQGGGSKDKH
jgi:hypothetical protein